MPPSPDIVQYRRELQADPRSLRFVLLADALRRAGELHEARQVLDSGLRFHPGFPSAVVVQAKVLRDLGHDDQALSLLDELYPREPEDEALVEVYCELLIPAGRYDIAADVLRRAAAANLSEAVVERLGGLLEAALSPEPVEELEDFEDLSSFGGVMTLPGLFLEELGDPFAVPIVAARVGRAGRRAAAKAIWRDVAQQHPAHVAMANRQIARLDGIAGRIQLPRAPAVVPAPLDRAEAAGRIRSWAERLLLDI